VTARSSFVGGPGISNADAPKVAAALKAIESEKGRLDFNEQAEALVERSRPKNSPTHHLFEWDAKQAHELYLIQQARHLIMSVRYVVPDGHHGKSQGEVVRAFPVVVTGGKKGPFPMARVMRDQSLMDALVEQAKADAVSWSRRYEKLRGFGELKGVFEAVDKLKK
jgi:hypothetical protein